MPAELKRQDNAHDLRASDSRLARALLRAAGATDIAWCPVRGLQPAAMSEWWERGAEPVDRLIEAVGWVIILATWRKERVVKQRLADVEVPNGIQLPVLLFLLSGKRQRSRQWAEAGKSLNELGESLAKRMIATDERQQQLVDLQGSLERLAQSSSEREETLVALQLSVTRYTKWLLMLTIVVALIGLGTIAVAATH